MTDTDRTGHWVLDPAHSTVAFSHKTMWGLVNVKGSAGGVTGEVDLGGDGSLGGQIAFGGRHHHHQEQEARRPPEG